MAALRYGLGDTQVGRSGVRSLAQNSPLMRWFEISLELPAGLPAATSIMDSTACQTAQPPELATGRDVVAT